MTSPEQQLAFAEAFGVMPSRQSAEAGYLRPVPGRRAFIAGGDYAQGPVNAPKMEQVLADSRQRAADGPRPRRTIHRPILARAAAALARRRPGR